MEGRGDRSLEPPLAEPVESRCGRSAGNAWSAEPSPVGWGWGRGALSRDACAGRGRARRRRWQRGLRRARVARARRRGPGLRRCGGRACARGAAWRRQSPRAQWRARPPGAVADAGVTSKALVSAPSFMKTVILCPKQSAVPLQGSEDPGREGTQKVGAEVAPGVAVRVQRCLTRDKGTRAPKRLANPQMFYFAGTRDCL